MKQLCNLFFLLLILSACDKDSLCENEAFCAEVNGKIWTPVGDGDFKTSEFTTHLIDDNNQFWIRAKRGSSTIVFGVIDPTSKIRVGTYVLNDSRNDAYYSPKSGEEFRTNANHTGLLTITAIDRTNKTIAGTFYFKAQNSTTGEVVDVSKGRFNTGYVEY